MLPRARRSARFKVKPSYDSANNVLNAPFHNAQFVTIQDLPVELVSLIISYIQGDKRRATLKSCSCLSHTWRGLTLPHVFASVEVPVEQLVGFATFVKSKSHIAALIKSLTIFCDRPSYNKKPMSFARNSSFNRILARLPAVEYLRCSFLLFSPSRASPALDSKLSARFKLRRFVWDKCVIDDAWGCNREAQFLRILSVVSLFDADTLDLILPWTDGLWPHKHISLAQPLAFKSVVVRGISSSAFLSCFCQNLSPDTLRFLTVSIAQPHHVAELGQLLHRVGRNLEHLRINFRNMTQLQWWTGPVLAELKLDSCPRLTTLNVTMLWGLLPDAGYISGFALARILAQAPASLREIRIPIFLSQPVRRQPSAVIDAVKLPAVERILTQPAFPSIRAFVFEFTKKENIELYRTLLEDMFPALRQRGVLYVEYLDHEPIDECLDVVKACSATTDRHK
ncbi:hypothetical protein LXA43DRAFT_924691 [Ganoderma leucocontextum]|nr:hypothetical protein LXA43DRAFT_924691 [Ganoderma leucocontextum]